MEVNDGRERPKLKDHLTLGKEIPLWGVFISFIIATANIVTLIWMAAVLVQQVRQHDEDIKQLKVFDSSVIELLHIQSEKILIQAQINVEQDHTIADNAARIRAIETRLMGGGK